MTAASTVRRDHSGYSLRNPRRAFGPAAGCWTEGVSVALADNTLRGGTRSVEPPASPAHVLAAVAQPVLREALTTLLDHDPRMTASSVAADGATAVFEAGL